MLGIGAEVAGSWYSKENAGKLEVSLVPSFSFSASFSPPFLFPLSSFSLCSIISTSSSSAASNSDALTSKSHWTRSRRSCMVLLSSSAFLSNSFFSSSAFLSFSLFSFSNRCFSIIASFFMRAAMRFFLLRIDDVVDDTFEAESPGFTLSFSSSSFLSLSSLTPPIAPPALVPMPEVATVKDGVRWRVPGDGVRARGSSEVSPALYSYKMW